MSIDRRIGSVLLVSLAATLALASAARAGDVSVKLDTGAGFSVKNSAGAVERLRVDEATGNVSRNGALFVHTSGTNNLFIGQGTGNPATTGSNSTAFGRSALAADTTGSNNTAIGTFALVNNSTGGGNTAVGTQTLTLNNTGGANSAFGYAALPVNTSGSLNTGVGFASLFSNTTGGQNVSVGYSAMRQNTTGHGNAALGSSALRANTVGYDNVAIGRNALTSNTYGAVNVAVGAGALSSNIGGYFNVAIGAHALASNNYCCNIAIGYYTLNANTTGFYNVANGIGAMQFNQTGQRNIADGSNALRANTTGDSNTAVGDTALHSNNTGARNIALGASAGVNQTTGNDNIYLANAGVAAESGQIKIGTVGTHTGTTIAGISGATSAGGVAVLVNASGKLGTTTSSARFKQDVRDMADASDVLMKLRPVVFHYKEDAVGAEDAKTTQYGLIAEEVEQVAPELVATDLDGKPYSVKYHELPALLLGEVQAERRINDQQRQVIAELAARLDALEGARGGVCAEPGR